MPKNSSRLLILELRLNIEEVSCTESWRSTQENHISLEKINMILSCFAGAEFTLSPLLLVLVFGYIYFIFVLNGHLLFSKTETHKPRTFSLFLFCISQLRYVNSRCSKENIIVLLYASGFPLFIGIKFSAGPFLPFEIRNQHLRLITQLK